MPMQAIAFAGSPRGFKSGFLLQGMDSGAAHRKRSAAMAVAGDFFMTDIFSQAVAHGVAVFGTMHPTARTEQFAASAASAEPGGRMQRLAAGFVFGQLWGDEALDRRARSLVTLGVLVALDIGEDLGGHIRVALANGVTPTEIEEAITHAAAYAGFPRALAAMSVAKNILEARDSPRM